MKLLHAAVIAGLIGAAPADSFAKGGFSSSAGSGSRGGFSSAPSRSYSAPSRSYSSPSYSSAPPRTTTTTTTTTNRSYSRGGGYGYGYGGGYGSYYHPMMMYPGFGMGYGYSYGLVEGLIIGNLMHPQGTTVYTGGGYNGNALLYPDGRVVDQNGYQVGNYANGQFAPVQNGQMVAQAAPPVEQSPPPAPAPQPVIVEQRSLDGWTVVGWILCISLGLFLLVAMVRWIMSWDYWDEEIETTVTTTTTTTTDEPAGVSVVGELKRKRQGKQFYVIDPADGTKNWLNDNDDLYEDDKGRVWRLV